MVRRLISHLDTLTRQHRRGVLLGWLVVVIAATPLATRETTHLVSGGTLVQGSQSTKVYRTLKREFPGDNQTALAVLIWPRADATQATISAAVHTVQRSLHGIPGISLTGREVQVALFSTGLLEPVVMPLEVHVTEARAQNIVEDLRSRLQLSSEASRSVEIHFLGESALWAGLVGTYKSDLTHAETIGVPILLIVLLAIFGSLFAASLPVMAGAVAVIVTGALIYLLSLTLQLSVFVTNTASMLGIGVAVDYSLIILARIRQELNAGRSLDEARRTALMTSGSAVIFSGVTVATSLFGLWAVPNNVLRSIALGGILVVSMSVLVSVTLLPALTGVLGSRRLTTNILIRHRASGSRVAHSKTRLSWDKWTRAVMRHPVVSILAVGSLLLVLCIPVLSMKTSTGALRQLGANNETRVGFDEAEKLAGPGSLGPVYVMVQTRNPMGGNDVRQGIAKLRALVGHMAEVDQLDATQVSSNGHYAVFAAILRVDPESPVAKRLVQTMRQSLASALTDTDLVVSIGGTSAIQLDEEREVATNLWKVIAIVLLVAFVILLIVLRSVILPLKALAMNLISVGAAYGVLVVVFQWGWFDSWFHYRSLGHLDTLTPVLIFAIVFGLSTDYEVFLLTRIRERWLVSGDARGAVADGLTASAGVISSAALILVCVFAVFVGTGIPSIKELGLGAAVAIAVDATLIRLILVPAIMALLGDRSWWWPELLPGFASSRPDVSQTTQ
jgi:uncharacterized membrane protein YdfJ with MMPL/SSD domain